MMGKKNKVVINVQRVDPNECKLRYLKKKIVANIAELMALVTPQAIHLGGCMLRP